MKWDGGRKESGDPQATAGLPRFRNIGHAPVLGMGFRQAFMFRPGGIIPRRGIRSSTRLYQFFYDYFMWMLKLIKRISPNSVVDTTEIGLAMLGSHVLREVAQVLANQNSQPLSL